MIDDPSESNEVWRSRTDLATHDCIIELIVSNGGVEFSCARRLTAREMLDSRIFLEPMVRAEMRAEVRKKILATQ